MTAISLHLGLNAVDPGHYAGWSGELAGCENDARDLAAIARAAGFDASVRLTRDARAEHVLEFLARAAATLASGDRLLLTFSGHGSQLRGLDREAADGDLDQTWLLFDRMILDDEVYGALAALPVGVRALVILDCGHGPGALDEGARPAAGTGPAIRTVPPMIAAEIARIHRPRYRRWKAEAPRPPGCEPSADAILLTACQGGQPAADGRDNGRFTAALECVWDGGRFTGSHRDLVARIRGLMPPEQVPDLYGCGPTVGAFISERPFAPSVIPLLADTLIDRTPRPITRRRASRW